MRDGGVTAADAAQLRELLRHNRRRHHTDSAGELLTDIYMIGLVVAVYGWAAVHGIRGRLEGSGLPAAPPGTRFWVATAAILAGAGLAWMALRSLGPLLTTPATGAWVISSPVDRREWLRPSLRGLLSGSAAGTGLLCLAAVAATGARGGTLVWSTATAALSGLAGTALAVIAQASARPTGPVPPAAASTAPASIAAVPIATAQPGSRRRRGPAWAWWLGRALVAAGTLTALAVVVAHAAGVQPPRPGMPLATVLGPVALVAAILAVPRAARVLGRVDRGALTAGADLAASATAATSMLDPTLLSGVLETRRWRSIGRVTSRPLGPRGLARRLPPNLALVRVLLRADLRRPLRHPSALMVWGALVLVMYVIAVAVPSTAAVAHLVLAYIAAGRLTGGLRAISRSGGLRRLLGGRDVVLRLVHLVVPALGTLVWYLVTVPAVRPGLHGIDLLLVPGVIFAAYRSGTRPPMRYGGPVAETPFGTLPVDLLRQLLRGADVIAGLVVLQLLLT